jgi:hypothetical protein
MFFCFAAAGHSEWKGTVRQSAVVFHVSNHTTDFDTVWNLQSALKFIGFFLVLYLNAAKIESYLFPQNASVYKPLVAIT